MHITQTLKGMATNNLIPSMLTWRNQEDAEDKGKIMRTGQITVIRM
jgi:hypothetical protein